MLDMGHIVDRLREVTRKNFPQHPAEYLAPGIPLTLVEQFEGESGLKLPQDVKEYLQLIGGEGTLGDGCMQSGVLLGLCCLSLDDIIREMKTWKQVMDANPDFAEWECQTFPPDSVQQVYCDPLHWVGLAIDGCGNSIGIDLAPGPRGKHGQVIVFGRDYDDKCVIADTWAEFLDECIAYIEQGKNFTIDNDFYEPHESGTYLDEIYERKVTEIREKYKLDY